jgi:hypothetical protein
MVALKYHVLIHWLRGCRLDAVVTSAGCNNRRLAAWTQLSERRGFCWLWTADSGTVDSGTSDIGTADSGTDDGGAADIGPVDNGTADSGTADSGTADIGTVDSGTADSGTANDGPCLVRYLPLNGSVSDSELGSIWAAVP